MFRRWVFDQPITANFSSFSTGKAGGYAARWLSIETKIELKPIRIEVTFSPTTESTMLSFNTTPTFFLAALLVATTAFTDSARAQQGGGGGGGGGGVGGGVPALPQQPTTPVPDNGGGNDAAAGGGGGASDGTLETVDPFRLEFNIEERRNQGFVGPTAQIMNERGFIGTPSEQSALPLAEDRSIGGGVNNGLGVRGAPNSSINNQENGFTVQRQNLRARLRPAFAFPQTPNYVVASRFQNRIARQPVVQQMGQGVKISIANKTATLTGSVSSDAERQIMIRQLRLEPGIYKIVDQTFVQQ